MEHLLETLLLAERMQISIDSLISLFKKYIKEKELIDYNDSEYNKHLEELQQAGFIDESGNIRIKEVNKFFYPKDEDNFFLFEEFYNLFPHVVPNGVGGLRPVSTKNPRGIQGKKTYKLWKNYVRKDEQSQRLVINCLKKELEYRTKQGTLMYLSNIDTWLRNSKWEEWVPFLNQNEEDHSNIKDL